MSRYSRVVVLFLGCNLLGTGLAFAQTDSLRTLYDNDAQFLLLSGPARTALESLTVLAVIGAARRQRRGPADVMQVPMFGE